MTGRRVAAGGKSHSWVTATSRSPSPSANTISVALGRSEQILRPVPIAAPRADLASASSLDVGRTGSVPAAPRAVDPPVRVQPMNHTEAREAILVANTQLNRFRASWPPL